jgi:hypothetical protein
MHYFHVVERVVRMISVLWLLWCVHRLVDLFTGPMVHVVLEVHLP